MRRSTVEHMNVSNAEQAAKKEDKLSTYLESEAVAAEFAERVRSNQAKLSSDLKAAKSQRAEAVYRRHVAAAPR